jgi:hypothetical protein
MKEKLVTIPKEKLLTYICIYRYAEPKIDSLVWGWREKEGGAVR